MSLDRESRRRRIALGLSAIAPVLLVALWLAFSGSDDGHSPAADAGPAGRSDASRPSSSTGRVPGADAEGTERSGEALASLAERQQALARQAEQRASGSEEPSTRSDSDAEEDYDEEFEDDPGVPEDAVAERDLREGPSREEIAELERIDAAETPSPEELARLMDDPPPLPSPGALIELKQRTAEMLDIPEDVIRELAAQSNAKEPTAEQLDELKAQRDRDKALIGETD